MRRFCKERPEKGFYTEELGEDLRVRFVTDVEENPTIVGGEEVYGYSEYVLRIGKREGMADILRDNLEEWTEFARAREYDDLAGKVREKRDRLLSESDWTQSPDSPLNEEKRGAWRSYRQSLRDLTKAVGFPYDVRFPTQP